MALAVLMSETRKVSSSQGLPASNARPGSEGTAAALAAPDQCGQQSGPCSVTWSSPPAQGQGVIALAVPPGLDPKVSFPRISRDHPPARPFYERLASWGRTSAPQSAPPRPGAEFVADQPIAQPPTGTS